jgi:hypothetical protein
MVVRFDAHFSTKGTKIEKEEEAGPPAGSYGLHLKNGLSTPNEGPPSEGSDHGDTQIGGGAALLIGPRVGENIEVLGVIGYDRYYYFVGNDDFVKLGLQGRRYFNDDTFWLGVEGSLVKDWAYIKDIKDNPDVGYAGYKGFDPIAMRPAYYFKKRTANGWMAGINGGYKIKQIKSLDLSIFAAATFMHLNDFEADAPSDVPAQTLMMWGLTTTENNTIITKLCHNNLHFRAGIELALPFSK